MVLRQFHCEFFLADRQVQLPTMEQNFRPVVGKVAKSARVGFDKLNGTIEAFGTSVTDFVLTEVQQPFFMAPEHLDYLFDGLQLAAQRAVRPGLKEALGGTLVAVAPEMGEVLLDTPCSAGLEVDLVQRSERNRLRASAIGVLTQPLPLAASQGRVPGLRQLAVLLLACFLTASMASPRYLLT